MPRLRLVKLSGDLDIQTPSYYLNDWCCLCQNKMEIECPQGLETREGLTENVCIVPKDSNSTTILYCHNREFEYNNILYCTLELKLDHFYLQGLASIYSNGSNCTIQDNNVLHKIFPQKTVNVILIKNFELEEGDPNSPVPSSRHGIIWSGSFNLRNQKIYIHYYLGCNPNLCDNIPNESCGISGLLISKMAIPAEHQLTFWPTGFDMNFNYNLDNPIYSQYTYTFCDNNSSIGQPFCGFEIGGIRPKACWSNHLFNVSRIPFNGYFTPGYEYDPNVYDILKDNSDIFHIYFPNTIDNIAPAWTDSGFQINLGCYVEITE